MAKKFAQSLSKAQFDFARKVERAGLASISQVVKAIERGDKAKIDAWNYASDAIRAVAHESVTGIERSESHG